MLAGAGAGVSAPKQEDGDCPLLSPGSLRTNMFTASGVAALALDSAFSPVRLSESHDSGGVSVAGSGVGGGDVEVTAKRMATSDLMAMLRPTDRHKIAELDAGFVLRSELAGAVVAGMRGREIDARMSSAAEPGAAEAKPITDMLSTLHCAEHLTGSGNVQKVFSLCTSVR